MAPRALVVAVRPVARSIRWVPLAVGAAGSCLVVPLVSLGGTGPGAMLGALRLAGFLLAAGGAFGLDDHAAATVAPSPLPLSVRRGLRLAVVLVPLGVVWLGAVGLALLLAPAGQPAPPIGAVTVEAAAMAAVALGAAAVAAPRAPDGLGGVAGGPALTLLVLFSVLAQARWPRVATLFPSGPADPQWFAAHARWTALAAAAAVATGVASADPARRPWRVAGLSGHHRRA